MSAIDWDTIPSPNFPLNVFVKQYQLYNEQQTNEFINNNNDTLKREFWFYHCIEPSGDQYMNTFIERPLIDGRLLFWYASEYNITGWLYYDVALWNGCPSEGIPAKTIITRYNNTSPFTTFNPANYIWCPRTDIFANGDGYFIYPGKYGPVTTSRLQNIRDGLEDLELIRMLKYQNNITYFVNKIVQSSTEFNLNPILLTQTRKQIYQTILYQRNL